MYKVNIINTDLYVASFEPNTNTITLSGQLQAQRYSDIGEAESFMFIEPEFYPPILLLPLVAVSPNSEIINP